MKLTAVYKRVPEGYLAFVEEFAGANTQAETLDEARISLSEAVRMVLEANRHSTQARIVDGEAHREPFELSSVASKAVR